MANVKGNPSKGASAPKPQEPTEVSQIPKIKDEAGKLLTLHGRDFPKSRDGRIAFCDYQIARWQAKKERVAIAADPKARKMKKIAQLKEMLAKLEEEVSSETSK
jgi:hypothetical protein